MNDTPKEDLDELFAAERDEKTARYIKSDREPKEGEETATVNIAKVPILAKLLMTMTKATGAPQGEIIAALALALTHETGGEVKDLEDWARNKVQKIIDAAMAD